MKKRYHALWILPIALVAYYKVRTMDIATGSTILGEAAVDTLAYNEIAKIVARQSTPLQEHNKDLDVPLITSFLNDQIQRVGLDPAIFKYYSGHAWLVFPEGNGRYGFILPGEKTFAGLLSSSLKSESLSQLLQAPDPSADPLYDDYRLQVVKTLIIAQFEGELSGDSSTSLAVIIPYSTDTALDNALSIALSALASYMYDFSTWLSYATTGGSQLYGKAAAAQKEGFLQMEIDHYVLKSNDIGLIEARIKDLKGQLKAEKESYITSSLRTIDSYMPSWLLRTEHGYAYVSDLINRTLPSSLQWGEEGYTAKRLKLFEEYLKDNKLELELYKKMTDKKRV